MSAKELVTEYYRTEAFRTKETMEQYLHDELLVQWHSSKGYLELEKEDLLALAAELDKSYSSSRVDISHLLTEDNSVTVRYTHYVNPIESPNEEMVLAHFVVIWEVKDNKFYKGYLMSQLG
ncbi:nuclear transport factor 2 family protein [Flavobacterium sp. DG1-102-2]|uniref:nuclear transport factor 2 family protein n=1 Tax=Flavobacterium sp. DG1-102-2 TaxID=3081663 RepID=UPI002949C15E|nr:nuclear transport factor 2 family protein [Flavobacterium sp. DG1-102-2]MDV6167255.1 nuclear transport factor 2 family protein [Flavobacterium sp. DG1-102-2]